MSEFFSVAECCATIQKLQRELAETTESLSRFIDTTSPIRPTLADLPERISVLKVAELIGVQPATVRKQWTRYGLIRSGRGRHGRTFYKTDSVLRYLRRRDVGGC